MGLEAVPDTLGDAVPSEDYGADACGRASHDADEDSGEDENGMMTVMIMMILETMMLMRTRAI